MTLEGMWKFIFSVAGDTMYYIGRSGLEGSLSPRVCAFDWVVVVGLNVASNAP